VILGAGGAAAAAALALSRGGASVALVARRPGSLRALPWDAESVRSHLATTGPTMLVNATPAPLDQLPIDVATLPETCTVVDLRYRYGPDDLVPAARARGLRATDGLEMLLQQGMLSFQLWTGLEPPHDVARRALHAAVGRS
jgi:shikimate dehydrogenase